MKMSGDRKALRSPCRWQPRGLKAGSVDGAGVLCAPAMAAGGHGAPCLPLVLHSVCHAPHAIPPADFKLCPTRSPFLNHPEKACCNCLSLSSDAHNTCVTPLLSFHPHHTLCFSLASVLQRCWPSFMSSHLLCCPSSQGLCICCSLIWEHSPLPIYLVHPILNLQILAQ